MKLDSLDTPSSTTENEIKDVVKKDFLQDMDRRIEALELKVLLSIAGENPSPSDILPKNRSGTGFGETSITSPLRQAIRTYSAVCHCPSNASYPLFKSLYSARFQWCPPNYYSLTLEERTALLGATSTSRLCKSMLMENRQALSSDIDSTYSQYYLLILQYEATINAVKLVSELRGLRPLHSRIDSKKFELRVASSQINDEITGYSHNAVSPFGMKNSSNVTIVVAKSIFDGNGDNGGFIWLGGGHESLKLGVAADEVVSSLHALVLDFTEPRTK